MRKKCVIQTEKVGCEENFFLGGIGPHRLGEEPPPDAESRGSIDRRGKLRPHQLIPIDTAKDLLNQIDHRRLGEVGTVNITGVGRKE